MGWSRILPEMVRNQPRHELVARWEAVTRCPLPAGLDGLMHEALASSHLLGRRTGDVSWEVTLPWQTLVLGVMARHVEETVQVKLLGWPEHPQVKVSCLPVRTHNAHAAGCAVVLPMAVVVWLLGGWTGGLPAGLTALAAGGLGASITRSMALQVLQRRLARLAADLCTVLSGRAPELASPPHHPPF